MAKKARKSSLSKKTNARRNTKRGRAKMKSSSFALPGKRYRIDDAAHARNALARVAQHGTPAEKKKVRAAVKRKYPSIGKRK
jgi:hypothetical protein